MTLLLGYILTYEAVDREVRLEWGSIREICLAVQSLNFDTFVESEVDKEDGLPCNKTSDTCHVGEPAWDQGNQYRHKQVTAS